MKALKVGPIRKARTTGPYSYSEVRKNLKTLKVGEGFAIFDLSATYRPLAQIRIHQLAKDQNIKIQTKSIGTRLEVSRVSK